MTPRDMERQEREDRQERARREVVAMLGALEAHAQQAVDLTQAALREPRIGNLAFWRAFRAKLDDFRALVSLIDQRLPALEETRAEALGEEFRRLDAAMLTLFVRTARVYFKAMIDRSNLPLAAHDVFRPELDLLREARERLAGGDGGGGGGGGGPALATVAAETLADIEEILRRVPALPDFDEPAPPSASPPALPAPPRLSARGGDQ